DGGVITTKSGVLNSFMIKFRNHGLVDRDHTEFWGRNSRLDTLQAAIARFKLKKIETINSKFKSIAAKYNEELSQVVITPSDKPHECSVYHNYVILSDRRDDLMSYLKNHGIDVKVRYPVPLTLQNVEPKKGVAPNAESLANRMLSLPIFPTMTDVEINYVITKVKEFYA
ncbi:DegT/DnrJ/EryC1/StrS family aminotransferase, partial [bacterium]|nr:DegT/DnrJ/EryC1/StrS family aminotransferase [bacterium]